MRHGMEENHSGESGDSRENHERKPVTHLSDRNSLQQRSDDGPERHGDLGQSHQHVESLFPPGHVADDQRDGHTIDAGGDAVENLREQQNGRIHADSADHRADRHDEKRDGKNEFVSPACAAARRPPGDRDHGGLGDEDDPLHLSVTSVEESQIEEKKGHDRCIGNLKKGCGNQKDPDCGGPEKIQKNPAQGTLIPDSVEFFLFLYRDCLFLSDLVKDQFLLLDQEQGKNAEEAPGPDREKSPDQAMMVDHVRCSDGAGQKTGMIPHLVLSHDPGEAVTAGQGKRQCGRHCQKKGTGPSCEEQETIRERFAGNGQRNQGKPETVKSDDDPCQDPVTRNGFGNKAGRGLEEKCSDSDHRSGDPDGLEGPVVGFKVIGEKRYPHPDDFSQEKIEKI